MSLRRDRGWGDTWGLIALGVVLCVVSVLGLTGAFGEISSVGRFETIVLVGVPLGLLAIGAGIVNWIRGWNDPGGPEAEDPVHAGDRAGLPGEDGSRPDGMIDR
ncbi:hypothetical protein ABID70_001667 [Clavibacter michiganensis]|uniref:hypothetical protein n=1 Tax=Clavibacter michiganensis TaxID=28447 RepID=UPI001AE39129|nr:hypothetical protein [Clavibacter michiganensis]MBP2459100.1 hypothetical protein [Clavibacter michiganensis]MDQ0411672.1 hypothetical protein [Clavibacter michiganensis]